jgi:hypothetical protein
MSSRATGECGEPFHALGEAFEAAGREAQVVLAVKVSNACGRGGG